MPLRRARPTSTSESARSAKRLAAIDSAFNQAVGYDATRYTAQQEADELAHKRSRRAAVPDDEEDEDDEMEMVASTSASAAPQAHTELLLGGGFLPEPTAEDAGGFLVDEPAAGGGFLLDDAAQGGGFIPEPAESAAAAGGFLPDPSASADEGGGFLLPNPSADTPMDAAPLDYDESGGFLPLPTNLANSSPSLDLSGAGGFLVDDMLPTPAPLTNRLPTPPPPPERIPLARIPAALRYLGLHRVGLQGAELMGLFDDVASDDEDGLGGRSVRRERFREACEVLLGDESASEKGDEAQDEYRAEEDDLELGEGRRRTRRQPSRRQPARKATRANPFEDGEAAEGENDVGAQDFDAELDALPDNGSTSSFASGSDGVDSDDEHAKGKKGAAKKGHRTRGDASRALSAQDLANAADSFDLFFDESPQLAFGQTKRAIGLMELQRACRVLKEKMSDGELNEMLEYAARSKGVVDIEAFARILLETGL